MPFRNILDVRNAGFAGFLSIAHLRASNSGELPLERGVYMVLRSDDASPAFRTRSTGGFFKGKDPTVRVDKLRRKWVDSAVVLYVGKAGGTNLKSGNKIESTLQSRVRAYLSFGAGTPVGHRGGRYIWQLEGSGDLIVCWMRTPQEEPMAVERRLIDQASAMFGAYPFANCRR